MPNTIAWRLMMVAAHDWQGDGPPVGEMDQVVAHVRDFTLKLGIELDRTALEGAMWCLASITGVANLFAASDGRDELEYEDTAIAGYVMRFIVVNMLDAMGRG